MDDRQEEPRTSLKDAARGGRGRPEGASRSRHRRAPLPLDRSILWTPKRAAGAPPPPATAGPYELFIGQRALQAAGEHVAGAEKEAHFGFLLGFLYRCPDTGVHYAVVDRALPAAEPFSEEAPAAFLLRAWGECQREYEQHGGVLMGWYHSHYLLGLFLSEGDRQTNERYFGEPWQCSVLMVPDRERPLGALFRPTEEQDREPEPAAFRELLAPTAARSPKQTVVSWTNYEPDQEVVPLAGTLPPLPEGEAPRDAAEGAGSTEVEAEEAPRSAATGEPLTLVLADDSAERRYPRLHRRHKRWLALIGAAVVLFLLVTAIRGLFSGGSGGTPGAVAVAPEVRRFRQRASDLDAAMARYMERGQDFELGRIGCELLGAGYSATDDAFVGLAAAFAELGAAKDSLTAEYDRLAEEMNEVNRHFDASGCPRPQ